MGRKSKAEEIYTFIRTQILSGRWGQGERLNDLKIAEEVQVSRLSVREALFRLTETGLIEKTHWKGYFIKEIDEEIISNIAELRMILESQVVKNLITDGTEEDFAKMEEIIKTSEELLNKNDLLSFLIYDYHFHELMHSSQHNSYITNTLKNYLISIHFIRYIAVGKDQNYIQKAKKSIKQHRLILEALKLRDEKLSTDHLIAHLLTHEQHAKNELSAFKPNHPS